MSWSEAWFIAWELRIVHLWSLGMLCFVLCKVLDVQDDRRRRRRLR